MWPHPLVRTGRARFARPPRARRARAARGACAQAGALQKPGADGAAAAPPGGAQVGVACAAPLGAGSARTCGFPNARRVRTLNFGWVRQPTGALAGTARLFSTYSAQLSLFGAASLGRFSRDQAGGSLFALSLRDWQRALSPKLCTSQLHRLAEAVQLTHA